VLHANFHVYITVPICQLLLVCIIGCIAAGHKGSTLRFSDVLSHEKSKVSPGVLAAVFEFQLSTVTVF